ncbi:hypothetical protein GGR56DRAFT_628774 [Xylariaceae sp. FL0804]|nr:hypothetical protein GGR56DRAFT_628774 [Xylariaceae sp. FL0804]
MGCSPHQIYEQFRSSNTSSTCTSIAIAIAMSGSAFRLLMHSFGRPSICPVCKRHFESYWEAAEHLHEVHETGFRAASYKYLPFALWHTAQKVLRARERVGDLETTVESLEKKQQLLLEQIERMEQQQQIRHLQRQQRMEKYQQQIEQMQELVEKLLQQQQNKQNKQLQLQQQIEQLQEQVQKLLPERECRHCKESFSSRTQLFKHLPTCSAVSQKETHPRTSSSRHFRACRQDAEAMATALHLAGFTIRLPNHHITWLWLRWLRTQRYKPDFDHRLLPTYKRFPIIFTSALSATGFLREEEHPRSPQRRTVTWQIGRDRSARVIPLGWHGWTLFSVAKPHSHECRILIGQRERERTRFRAAGFYCRFVTFGLWHARRAHHHSSLQWLTAMAHCNGPTAESDSLIGRIGYRGR